MSSFRTLPWTDFPRCCPEFTGESGFTLPRLKDEPCPPPPSNPYSHVSVSDAVCTLTRGSEDEHWPGNYLHAWTWASAWHPSGCGSRSPPSTPWGRRRRWCAPWCTSGQVRIPPPSRLFRLPVIKQNKQSRDREVTQAFPLPHTIPAQSRWLCTSQYLTAKVLGCSHCVRVFPPICSANDLRCWLPDRGCLVCTETVNSVTHKYCTGRTASGGAFEQARDDCHLSVLWKEIQRCQKSEHQQSSTQLVEQRGDNIENPPKKSGWNQLL